MPVETEAGAGGAKIAGSLRRGRAGWDEFQRLKARGNKLTKEIGS